MVSDKSPCARELLTPLRRQSHAVSNKHRAIYLYPARARRFVRRGSQRGRAMALSRSQGQAGPARPAVCAIATRFGVSTVLASGIFSDASDRWAVRNVREFPHPHKSDY